MGVNPSTFKQGGFLNGKDVTWTGYAFQSKTFIAKSGDNAGEPFTPVAPPDSLKAQMERDEQEHPRPDWAKRARAIA